MRILIFFCLLSANGAFAQHIMAVFEETGDSYYLLKNGKRVGADSVFMIDFQVDCESEGKILFHDKKTDRVGFFDKDGKIAIPANYNFAGSFYNGVTLAGINGVRSCENCEHRGWKQHEVVLINDKNEILVRNWNIYAETLNWYSMRVNDPSVDTATWISVKGEKGNVYSFLDFKKEFEQWVYSDFIKALNAGPVATGRLLFPEITYDASRGDWRQEPKDVFLKKYFADMQTSITKAKPDDVRIFDEELNPYIFEDKKYARFHDACGRHLRYRHPMFNFVINYMDSNKKLDYQEHFTFIKMEDGYKLLSVQFKEMNK
jgi:hypothetical protein